jgi:hypothetical protein
MQDSSIPAVIFKAKGGTKIAITVDGIYWKNTKSHDETSYVMWEVIHISPIEVHPNQLIFGGHLNGLTMNVPTGSNGTDISPIVKKLIKDLSMEFISKNTKSGSFMTGVPNQRGSAALSDQPFKNNLAAILSRKVTPDNSAKRLKTSPIKTTLTRKPAPPIPPNTDQPVEATDVLLKLKFPEGYPVPYQTFKFLSSLYHHSSLSKLSSTHSIGSYFSCAGNIAITR